MTYNTIDNDMTMAGGAEGALGRIDKYELRRELGEGGFGTVYLARDTVADVDVAVKGLPPEVKHNESELESIRGNFALVKRLRHPNIVAVTDLHQALSVSYASKDVESKLRVFERDTMVVMDYAPGVTLAQWRRQFPGGKVPLDKAIAVVRQVASALDYAHGQKVLHRDVKPANVMVESADGGKLVARVLDFGLAAEIRSSMGRLSREIRDTSGTRPYMAPEQWKGERQGPATDQYALAAMFYELVVGDVPFASVFDCGDPAVMRIAVTTDAPAIPADLPKCVRRALSVALAKKPEDRFATCGEFAAALEGKAEVPHGGARTGGAGKLIAALALVAAIGAGWYWISNKYDEGMQRRVAEHEEPLKEMETGRQKVEKEKERTVVEKERFTVEKEKQEKEISEECRANKERMSEIETAQKNAETEKERIAAEHERIAAEKTIREEEIAKEKREGGERMKELEIDRMNAEAVLKERAEQNVSAKQAIKTIAPSWEEVQGAINDCNLHVTIALKDTQRLMDEIAPFRSMKGDFKGVIAEIDRNWIELSGLPKPATLEASKLLSEKAMSLASSVSSGLDELRKRRDSYILLALKNAREYKERELWNEVLKECDMVFGWEPTNAEAMKLKKESEINLKPSAKIVATIGGHEVQGANLYVGSKVHAVPIKWMLREGSSYGPYIVEFKNEGKLYRGVFDKVIADWQGLRTLTVALKEYVGPKTGDTKMLTLPERATMEMIYVDVGSFTMGSPITEDGHDGDEIQHCVVITKGFWLGKYEVTQKQWQSVMGSNPSNIKGDNLPVENVSWDDCQKFIRKVNDAARRQFGCGARLPTEAEWEYACRAGTTTAYSWGNALNGDKANCDGNYPCGTTVKGSNKGQAVNVGSYQPNAWGFCDMHGNVCEWCMDWYGDYSSGRVTDPAGPTSGTERVLRGGCWGNYARNCRSAYRSRYIQGVPLRYYGFRLCCSADYDVISNGTTSISNGEEPRFTTYTVQRGDYLAKISKEFSVPIRKIKLLNNLQEETLRVGQVIKLPGNIDVGVQDITGQSAIDDNPNERQSYDPYVGPVKDYVVRTGDTLGGIAYSNGINIRQLKELNNMDQEVLRVGQILKVPAKIK